jgi:DNA-binding NtrC family response regulator
MAIEVVVVDEDQDILDLMEAFLSREDGLAITTEPDPERALQRISDGEFDAIVSDLTMPKLDGLELAKRSQAAVDDVPFFLFTGRDPTEVEGYESAPITGYLQKGTGTDQYGELATMIKAAVDDA